MADNIDGVVVTERMLTEAVQAGDLERLASWARQGVHVTTARPLYFAALYGQLESMRLLVRTLGADVNQTMPSGSTALTVAASEGHLDVVRCLVELGARTGAVDNYGNTAIIASARDGQYVTVKYLLEGAGANMEDADNFGNNVWTF
jgi:ankyrin repeat protein